MSTSIRRRLAALEAYVPAAPRCPTCGAGGAGPGFRFIFPGDALYQDLRDGSCPACGCAVPTFTMRLRDSEDEIERINP